MLSLNYAFNNLSIFTLVFARIAAILAFNPLFSRKNVPHTVRMALIFWLSIAVFPAVSQLSPPQDPASFILALFTEILIGFFFSFVFIVFNYMLIFAGEILDMQLGLAMSKVFDPGTSIQMSVTSNLLNIIFVLYFFACDAHLAYINIIADSFGVVQIGAGIVGSQFLDFVVGMFTHSINLCIKLTLPFLAAQFTTEILMGVLMKMVPQIHVFVINIQVKLVMGIFLLFLYAYFIGDFIDKYMGIMLTAMNNSFGLFV
ncbi:MAG: flagellar biosynthetic protein FliR [Oscillospiraceae bacterium]